MPRLTKRLVDSIKPAERDITVWDSDLSGFGVRVRPSERKTYILKYRVGGGRTGTIRKPAIGVHGNVTCDEARAIAKTWLGEIARGGDPSMDRQLERKAPTVNDLCSRYLAEHAEVHKKPSSLDQDRRMIRLHIRPALGKWKVAELTRGEISRFHKNLSNTPHLANRCLALLSKALNLAEVWNWRPDGSNPCHHVKRFKETKRERFLSLQELSRLGEALSAAEQGGAESRSALAAIRLLLLTGCRLSEIITLRWEYVDFENACLRLPDSKTGAKVVYLPAPALEILNGLVREKGNPFVLPGRKIGEHVKRIYGPWNRVCQAAGMPDVRVHDLRHSFASVSAAAGHSLPLIGKMLGHMHATTTQRYAHLSADPVRQAVEQVGSRIAAAMQTSHAQIKHIEDHERSKLHAAKRGSL